MYSCILIISQTLKGNKEVILEDKNRILEVITLCESGEQSLQLDWVQPP